MDSLNLNKHISGQFNAELESIRTQVMTMGDAYGAPYNVLNGKMFANGAAGYGVASLCGSLGGACAVIGLFCEAEDALSLIHIWEKL